MLRNIKVGSFKCLSNEDIIFKPLTIITGVNSSGKSSLIQSILYPLYRLTSIGDRLLEGRISSDYASLRNKYTNSSNASCDINNGEIIYSISADEALFNGEQSGIALEDNCYYLSANRIGVENVAMLSQDYKVGIDGEYIFGTFENEKSRALDVSLLKDTSSHTLAMQVNYWLTYISDVALELKTEIRQNDKVEINFSSDGLVGITPANLGAGVSYLAKILIMCLRAKKDDVIIIENPEIHLHPASQAKLGTFFAFIVKSGIQVIIETHCEHLINMVAYQVFDDMITSDDVVILYKSAIQSKFETVELCDNGKFIVDFPEGFFDATLSELLKME